MHVTHCKRQTLTQGMGAKQGSVAGDGLNRKHISANKKKNLLNKNNRKNIREKQAKSPARILTTKPLYVPST